ncbi:hypothetical protein [Mycobacterium aquaticum]|uniref:hypothetical protein n=1 Tax=Mycobacterium aquaticum TaxID=1927124 RepID=UPI0011540C32|nr:hypothetical protein [Mycobacterium aquaticum]
MSDPCVCGHARDEHQPVCVAIVEVHERHVYCACPQFELDNALSNADGDPYGDERGGRQTGFTDTSVSALDRQGRAMMAMGRTEPVPAPTAPTNPVTTHQPNQSGDPRG